MSEYRCPIQSKLKPASHDEWHWDGGSNVCPVLRDEMLNAVDEEKWKRVKKLMKLLQDNFPNEL